MAKEEPVSKVTFENMDDFKFKIAFDKYSYIFDSLNREEDKDNLNKCISQLFNKEISYPQFYSEINRYGEDTGRSYEFRRTRIKGQRKREYQHKAHKMARLKRHKKR